MKRLFLELLLNIVAGFIAIGIATAIITWWVISR